MSSRPPLPVLLGFFSAWGLVGALAFAFLLVPGLGPGEEAGGESIITTYYYNQVPAPLCPGDPLVCSRSRGWLGVSEYSSATVANPRVCDKSSGST